MNINGWEPLLKSAVLSSIAALDLLGTSLSKKKKKSLDS